MTLTQMTTLPVSAFCCYLLFFYFFNFLFRWVLRALSSCFLLFVFERKLLWLLLMLLLLLLLLGHCLFVLTLNNPA